MEAFFKLFFQFLWIGSLSLIVLVVLGRVTIFIGFLGALLSGYCFYLLWKKWPVARVLIGVFGSLACTLVFILAITFGPFLISMLLPGRADDFPTTLANENPSLLNTTSGTILYEVAGDQKNSFEIKSLPDGTILPVQIDNAIDWLTTVDAQGNVYYAAHETPSGDKYKLVKYSPSDQKKETILSLHGKLAQNYDGLVSISPSGNIVAYLSNAKTTTLKNKSEVEEGSLLVWDIINKKQLPLNTDATTEGVSWTTDSKEFLYTKVVGGKEKIYKYNVRTNEDTYVIDGKHPVLNSDTGTVVYTLGDDIYTYSKQNPTPRIVTLPGIIQKWYRHKGIIGFAGRNKVIYWAYVTQGVTPQWTKNNSPLVGRKPYVTLKIGTLDTGEIQTVIEAIDPRLWANFQ